MQERAQFRRFLYFHCNFEDYPVLNILISMSTTGAMSSPKFLFDVCFWVCGTLVNVACTRLELLTHGTHTFEELSASVGIIWRGKKRNISILAFFVDIGNLVII